MSETWAKDGDRARQASLDLHLDLPGPKSSKGIRLGLEAALRDAVRTGRLGPGTRLPSSRALAADLGLARNTVAEVYSQLVAEGWLTPLTGSGALAAGGPPPPLPPAPGCPRPVRLPARRVAGDRPQGAGDRAPRVAGLPGSARAPAAEDGAGRVPKPGAARSR